MLYQNIKFKPYKPINTWRKIALGTWKTAKDPSIYGMVDIDATEILRSIAENKENGIRLTPTTIVAKAVSVGIEAYPRINGVLRFGRIYERTDIDIFLQVSAADGFDENLSGMVIRKCNNKTLPDIANEISKKSKKIKEGMDEDFIKVKSSMDKIPGIVVSKILDFLSVFMYGFNLWSPLLGTPKDSFGSAMVTSVGGMGIEYGFAPLTPYSRCPILVAVGKITDKAVVENGEIKIKPMLPLCVTLDHRLIDGYGASKMLKRLLDYFKNPI